MLDSQQQATCCKCGLDWIIAKGQQIGMSDDGYVCP